MSSAHECMISGARGYYRSYAFFNGINDTSYRPFSYSLIHEVTEDGFNANYPHKLGIELTDSYKPADVGYKRTIKITIIDFRGCTITFNSNPEIPSNSDRTDYTKLSATYYPTAADSNAPGAA